jgi:hypothetical protein
MTAPRGRVFGVTASTAHRRGTARRVLLALAVVLVGLVAIATLLLAAFGTRFVS